MIGAASSGKSTAARILARQLQERESRRVRYVSSAEIRRRLYGDRGVLGQWAEVEAEIGQQLLEAIAAQESVIVEASYVRRAFRLAITQALVLPVAVQWIGWWLDTPLEQCLEWNRQRPVGVPEEVIRRHCAQLLQAAPVPQRQEDLRWWCGCAVTRACRWSDWLARSWSDSRRASGVVPTGMVPTGCMATRGCWIWSGCCT